MAVILNIETSGKNCSVALAENDELLLLKEVRSDKFVHAEQLHFLISNLLKDADLSPAMLDAVAISEGPGSYTGLRIGLATAKGLAYTLAIPLIALPTLRIMANGALKNHASTHLVPMIDARRMEVYVAVYDRKLNPIKEVESVVVDSAFAGNYLTENAVVFGDGGEKCTEFIGDADYLPALEPSASFMVGLSAKEFKDENFVDLAYFEPNYLKEFQAGKPKKMFP